jgi:hypothetical protein
MSLREHNISHFKLLVISKFICEVRNVFRANTVKDKEEDNKETCNKHKYFVLRKLQYWRISLLTRKQQWDDETGLNKISLLSSHWHVYPISARHAVKTKWKRLFVNGCEMEEKYFYSGGIFKLVPGDRADGSTWSAFISKYSDTSVQ